MMLMKFALLLIIKVFYFSKPYISKMVVKEWVFGAGNGFDVPFILMFEDLIVLKMFGI